MNLKSIKTVEQLSEKKESRVKKSGVKWKPAALLDNVQGLDRDNWEYRWVNKDPANVLKKKAEGWSFVNKVQGDKVEHDRPGNLVDGNPITDTLTEYREMVMMKIPREMAEARNEYYQEKVDDSLEGLVNTPAEQGRSMGGVVTAWGENLNQQPSQLRR